jgi:hemerythrin-like domain-containing protein
MRIAIWVHNGNLAGRALRGIRFIPARPLGIGAARRAGMGSAPRPRSETNRWRGEVRMDAILVMMREHEQILQVLEALDRFVDAVHGMPGDKLELGRFVTFIREYADERHHGKEEHVLFTAMARNGFPPEQGPVGMMLLEHQEMRGIVSVLRELAEQDAPWGSGDQERVADAARSYTGMLREHIMKENEMLYPMAMEHLPPAVQDEVDEECAALDQGRVSAGTDATLEKLAVDLVARYANRPQRSG